MTIKNQTSKTESTSDTSNNVLISIEDELAKLKQAFPYWDVNRRDGSIRLARYFHFKGAESLTEFDQSVGNMMRTQSVFVLAQRVPGNHEREIIVLRIKVKRASLIAGVEIAKFIEEQYSASQDSFEEAA